jgi:DNA-binding transcriptional regulator of glucitol operon
MKTARSLLVAIVLLLGVAAAAQITFSRIISEHYNSVVRFVSVLPDTGYVFIGRATSQELSATRTFVVQTDTHGFIEQTRLVEGALTGQEYMNDAERVSDGGWIVVALHTNGTNEGLLQRLSPTFDTLWTQTFSWASMLLWGVCSAEDSGFLAVGYEWLHYTGQIVRTNVNGDTLWTHTLWPPSSGAMLFDVVSLPDSGYAVAGRVWLPLPDTTGPAILRLNAFGDTLWVSTIELLTPTGDGEAHSIIATSDGGFVAVGWPYHFAFKIDSAGNWLWTRTYSNNLLGLTSGVELQDGGFVFCGIDTNGVLIIRADENGDSLWTRHYPSPGEGTLYDVQITTDGGFVFAGEYGPFWSGKAWLLKTDSLGFLETIPPVIESTTVWTDTTFLGSYPVGSDITDNVAVDSARIYENITHDYSPPDSIVGPRYFFTVPAGPHPSGSAICYQVEAWDISQNYSIDSMYCFNVITSAPDVAYVPDEFALHAPAPNPFNPTTRISFSLPEASHVRLEVFDLLGRKVATLRDEPMDAGEHEVGWDASGFSSGVYLVRLNAGDQVATAKLVLLK